MIINHNIAALNTYRQLTTNNAGSAKQLEKLSSGLRINRAGDDAAGLAISEKMRAQIRGLDQASRNAQDSISLIQTTEGALNETHSILQRMRELAIQAANDTNVEVDRGEIQKEINQLTSEINRIGNTTEFNTQKLLNGDKANTFEVTGTSFSGGGNTAALQGLAATLNAGSSALSSGNYQLVVTSNVETSGVITTEAVNINQMISGSVAQITYDADTRPTFSGDISITAGAGNWMPTGGSLPSGASLTIDVMASGGNTYVHVTATSSGFSSDDYVLVDASGNAAYNANGVSFSLNVSGWNSGDTVTFTDADGGFAGATIGTEQSLWSSVALTDPTGTAPTLSGGGVQTTSGVAEGNWTIEINMSGSINSIVVKMSGGADGEVIHDIISGGALSGAIGGYYSNHGISFNLTNLGDLDSGTHSMEFTTTQQVTTDVERKTFSAHLTNASGTVVGVSGSFGSSAWTSGTASNVIVGNQSGAVGMGGLSLNISSGSAIVSGSTTFEVDPTTSGENNSMTFQIGANQNQVMSMDINDMRSAALGISSSAGGTGFSSGLNVTDGTSAVEDEHALDVTTASGAANAITVINNAIESVSAERAKLGAVQNRLEHTINNLGTSAENLQAAESRIRDVDMARTMMEFTKNNILQQAAQAMLAQANQQPQGVLQLLR